MKTLITLTLSIFSINFAISQQGHFRVKTNKFVQIGYDTYKYPQHKLDVNGDIATYGTVRIYSDENLKINITRLQAKNCLELITQINAYSYNLKYDHLPNNYQENTEITEVKQKTIEAENADTTTYNNQPENLRNGFMAQEVEKILPALVKTDGEGYKSIDYIGLIPIMLEAIKEQQKEIEKLKSEIKNLKK